MSRSSSPRIRRGPAPSRRLTESNYRKAAWPALKRDFRSRCAYSMLHGMNSGGDRCMEVDHFNPTLSGDSRHVYLNLFLASRHCNLLKSDHWPDEEDVLAGIRFLDPCNEQDYSYVIFEDRRSGELVGTTPAAKWHIDILVLNAPHLVEARQKRTGISRVIESVEATLADLEPAIPEEMKRRMREGLRTLRREQRRAIPRIAFLDNQEEEG